MYLVPNSPAFDRAAIFAAAHMSAHLYHRSSGGYRSAFREGLKAAWKQAAIERTAFVLRGGTREDNPKVTAIRHQIFMLQMRDRLTERDYSEISHLKDEVAAQSKRPNRASEANHWNRMTPKTPLPGMCCNWL